MDFCSQQRPRLIIADDQELILEACFNQLEPEFEVVALVSDGRDLVQATNELRPDVVILDIAMPNLNGLLAAELINRRLPTVKLIFLSMCVSPQVAAEAFHRGALGYVVKTGIASELVVATRRALQGRPFLSRFIKKDTIAPSSSRAKFSKARKCA